MRHEVDCQIYRVGAAEDPKNASTEFDPTAKVRSFPSKARTYLQIITPVGGFTRYPNITNDFIMLKGAYMAHRPLSKLICRKRARCSKASYHPSQSSAHPYQPSTPRTGPTQIHRHVLQGGFILSQVGSSC